MSQLLEQTLAGLTPQLNGQRVLIPGPLAGGYQVVMPKDVTKYRGQDPLDLLNPWTDKKTTNQIPFLMAASANLDILNAGRATLNNFLRTEAGANYSTRFAPGSPAYNDFLTRYAQATMGMGMARNLGEITGLQQFNPEVAEMVGVRADSPFQRQANQFKINANRNPRGEVNLGSGYLYNPTYGYIRSGNDSVRALSPEGLAILRQSGIPVDDATMDLQRLLYDRGVQRSKKLNRQGAQWAPRNFTPQELQEIAAARSPLTLADLAQIQGGIAWDSFRRDLMKEGPDRTTKDAGKSFYNIWRSEEALRPTAEAVQRLAEKGRLIQISAGRQDPGSLSMGDAYGIASQLVRDTHHYGASRKQKSYKAFDPIDYGALPHFEGMTGSLVMGEVIREMQNPSAKLVPEGLTHNFDTQYAVRDIEPSLANPSLVYTTEARPVDLERLGTSYTDALRASAQAVGVNPYISGIKPVTKTSVITPAAAEGYRETGARLFAEPIANWLRNSTPQNTPRGWEVADRRAEQFLTAVMAPNPNFQEQGYWGNETGRYLSPGQIVADIPTADGDYYRLKLEEPSDGLFNENDALQGVASNDQAEALTADRANYEAELAAAEMRAQAAQDGPYKDELGNYWSRNAGFDPGSIRDVPIHIPKERISPGQAALAAYPGYALDEATYVPRNLFPISLVQATNVQRNKTRLGAEDYTGIAPILSTQLPESYGQPDHPLLIRRRLNELISESAWQDAFDQQQRVDNIRDQDWTAARQEGVIRGLVDQRFQESGTLSKSLAPIVTDYELSLMNSDNLRPVVWETPVWQSSRAVGETYEPGRFVPEKQVYEQTGAGAFLQNLIQQQYYLDNQDGVRPLATARFADPNEGVIPAVGSKGVDFINKFLQRQGKSLTDLAYQELPEGGTRPSTKQFITYEDREYPMELSLNLGREPEENRPMVGPNELLGNVWNANADEIAYRDLPMNSSDFSGVAIQIPENEPDILSVLRGRKQPAENVAEILRRGGTHHISEGTPSYFRPTGPDSGVTGSAVTSIPVQSSQVRLTPASSVRGYGNTPLVPFEERAKGRVMFPGTSPAEQAYQIGDNTFARASIGNGGFTRYSPPAPAPVQPQPQVIQYAQPKIVTPAPAPAPAQPKFYAGIGSRNTPSSVQEVITELAGRLEDDNWILRSGAAQGADQAFMRGIKNPEAQQIYLPWDNFKAGERTFNANAPGFYNYQSLPGYTQALASVGQFHPNATTLTQWARHLMGRNAMQILGPDLQTPSKVVYAYTPEGQGGDGTGQAIRIAQRAGIPVQNLGNPEILDRVRSNLRLRPVL